MFKRLKQQIEQGDVPNALSTPKKVGPRNPLIDNSYGKIEKENIWEKRCLSTTTLYSSRESLDSNVTVSRVSNGSLFSSPESPIVENVSSDFHRGRSSKDDVLTELTKKSNHVKMLEGKIKEMATVFKKQAAEKDMLEEALLTTKADIRQHVEFNERNYQNKLTAAQEDFERKLQSKDKELNDLFRKRDEEITRHRRELLLASSRNVDVNDMNKQQQEEICLTKEKLIHAQAEMSKKAAELMEKSKHLENLDDQYIEQRNLLSELQNRLDDLARERSKNEIRDRQLSMLNATLEKEKAVTQSKLDEAICEVAEKSGRLDTAELSLRRVSDELKSLKQTHNSQKSKTSEEVQQKDTEIDILREKIQDFEQRLRDSSLSVSDQGKAFESERNIIERRLQDARNQLAEQKQQYNEKISTLGSLVSSLDEQLKKREKELAEHKDNSNYQVSSLQRKIAGLEEQLIITESSNRKEQFAESYLVESLKSKIEDLEKTMRNLQEENSELQAAADREGLFEAQNKLLESRLKESNSKGEDEKNKSEDKIRELQSEIRKLTFHFEHSNRLNMDTLESKVEQQERRINHYQQANEQLLKENEKIKVELSAKEDERMQSLVCFEDAMKKVTELKTQISTLEESLREKNDVVSQLEKAEPVMEKEDMSMRNARANEIGELNVANRALSAELDEARKKMKSQQQKITDLKKAYQKEMNLKVESQDDSRREKKDCALTSPTQQERGSSSDLGVNFTYLKHVVLKYMCSSNSQSRQLVGVIAHLLQFSPREEKIVKNCIEWKLPLQKE